MDSLKICQVSLNELNAAEYNPRVWSEKNIRDLKASIKRFGLVDPLIVNGAAKRRNVVIGGHFRLKIAHDLGYEKVPVVYIDLPDIRREKELNLRLNRNQGEWDWELLKGFDPTLLMNVGFDDTDLSHIWDEALETEDDDFDVDEALAAITKPKTQPGDLIELGDHRLICGDSTDRSTIERLLDSVKPALIYTDPPYNIQLDYNKGIGGKGRYGGTQTDDGRSVADYRQFLAASLSNALALAAPDVHVMTWCDQNYIGLLQALYPELGVTPKRMLTWIKNQANPTPKLAFNKATESCVYGTRGKPYVNQAVKNLTEILNKEVSSGNRTIDDILDLLDIMLVKRLPASEYEHPTQKPVTLHEKPLRRLTKAGDAVLDLFGGSGSTLIACEQLKRRAYLCELEPVFCDVIVARFEQLTGCHAIYHHA